MLWSCTTHRVTLEPSTGWCHLCGDAEDRRGRGGLGIRHSVEAVCGGCGRWVLSGEEPRAVGPDLCAGCGTCPGCHRATRVPGFCRWCGIGFRPDAARRLPPDRRLALLVAEPDRWSAALRCWAPAEPALAALVASYLS